MAIFSGISHTISSLSRSRKPVLQRQYPKSYKNDIQQQSLDGEPLSPFTKTNDWLKNSPVDEDLDILEGDTVVLEDLQSSRKRPTTPSCVGQRPAKRQKSTDGYHNGSDDEDSDLEGDTLVASTPVPRFRAGANRKAQEDRQAMPPPPPKPAATAIDRLYTPAQDTVDRNLRRKILRKKSFDHDAELSEEEIFTKKTAVRREDRSEVNPRFQYNRALHHAQAQQLPEDARTWSEAEKDLFFRLAMRGFEPLVPGHWSMDFKTLPQLLFSTKGQEPLIQPFDEREFRAKHYLRNLFGIAAKVRDRRLAGLRTEPSIKRILRQYIDWALLDAGVHPCQRPKVIPVHTMVTMRRGETTQDVIRRMSERLYRLARRYQALHRVRPSIEPQSQDPQKPSSSLEASVEYDDAHMPTLIGLMIASSVVAVVTLDSRSQPPQSPSRKQHGAAAPRSPPFPPSPVPSTHEETSSIATLKVESGLRFIAKFDFSTHDGYDVWDGLAMAICIMRIRKTMLELCQIAEREGQAGKGGVWEKAWPNRRTKVEMERE